MSASISRQQAGQRTGVDCCPGVDERGHGLTAATIHDSQCCEEWGSGVASPARAEAFTAAASRWGSTWPGHDEPEAGQ